MFPEEKDLSQGLFPWQGAVRLVRVPQMVGLWKRKPQTMLWYLQKLSWEHESCGLGAKRQQGKIHSLSPGLDMQWLDGVCF